MNSQTVKLAKGMFKGMILRANAEWISNGHFAIRREALHGPLSTASIETAAAVLGLDKDRDCGELSADAVSSCFPAAGSIELKRTEIGLDGVIGGKVTNCRVYCGRLEDGAPVVACVAAHYDAAFGEIAASIYVQRKDVDRSRIDQTPNGAMMVTGAMINARELADASLVIMPMAW